MLQNKIAVVTGGTRGIGYAVVKKYLDNGATVVLFGSREETVEKALLQLKAENANYKVSGMAPNLNDPKAIEEAFAKIKAEHGSLDILVNNAGISQRESIYDMDPAAFQKVMDLNVNSIFICSQAAIKLMKEQGSGCIINTSSMVSIFGQSSGVGYPTSKFAVNGMTRSLARELGPDNIRVNAVAPGVTNTDMVRVLPKEIIQPIINDIPLRRVGEPEDIANAFLFLASDMASYITGVVLSVDGAART